MFQSACSTIRESLYGIKCSSQVDGRQIVGTGTGFLIAPGVVATASHVLHHEGDWSKPIHPHLQVIRAPKVGGQMHKAELIADFPNKDLAFLRIEEEDKIPVVELSTDERQRGEQIGSLGFPLATMKRFRQQQAFVLIERFQSGFVSAKYRQNRGGSPLSIIETDSNIYSGSSGCPGFDPSGKVFGLLSATKTDRQQKGEAYRLAIAMWIPSAEIIDAAHAAGIRLVDFEF
ncbi:MAG: trypsin-like peptidase domain-containing protein [Flavobacteriales bacterium]|nr:trypsin-like peptidase domain-containing protein [Flavobacteriales bacterium]